MLARPLLYLLFAVLVGTGAYWVAVISLGGLRDNPFRRLVVAPTWPLPADAAAHPFWARFPDLRSADYDKQHAAWQTLLAYDRTELPHPAAKPAAWPLADRIFAHALLWRLWRGKSFRAGGLEFRLDREENAPPPRMDEPAGFRLGMVATAGTGRVRFPRDLRMLLDAGAELHFISQPPAGLACPPFSTAARDHPPRADEPRPVHAPLVLHAPRIAALPLLSAGQSSLRIVLDLTRVVINDPRVPRGIWVSNALVLDVAAAE